MFVYIHIPFCASRCIYCDFYVVLAKYGGQQAYVEAVCREIYLRLKNLAQPHSKTLQTVYIGGGTPSLLPASAYQKILQTLNCIVPFSNQVEITLEINPNALESTPADYKAVGINRLSVGIQSLNDTELKRLSRAHTAADAKRCIGTLQAAGFENISVDLMYGICGQTLETWQQTLKETLALGVPHLSMYGLHVEPNTPLQTLLPYAAYQLPLDEETVAMYQLARDVTAAAGFEAYEFSNFAKPGYASGHNLNYWRNGDFLALGASAHGQMGGIHYETVCDMETYLSHPLAGVYHRMSRQEQLENAMILGLRKAQGVCLKELETRYQVNVQKLYDTVIKQQQQLGALQLHNGRLILTPSFIPLSNTVLEKFLLSDPI